MQLALASLAWLGGMSLLALLFMRRRPRLSALLSMLGAITASLAGIAAGVSAVLDGSPDTLVTSFRTALGPLRVGADPLSGFFLVCVFLVSGLASLYSVDDLFKPTFKPRKAHMALFFNVLLISMALILLARDALLFLAAWEGMSLSSFFLVTHHHERAEVRRAGIVYLIASHASLIVLGILFMTIGAEVGGLDFLIWQSRPLTGFAADACFLIALLGFGLKAGFWPLHVWLPEAHPAAPSHISALMSGVMIKLGIYGLLRTLDFVGAPPVWWGALVLGLGAISALLGVLHVLATDHLKRLLAYSSVENIGIILMGLGLGLLGLSLEKGDVAFLGFAGALLHVFHHGLFKGLLFQGAGAILHATGEGQLTRLGGLLRRMPHTGKTMLFGALAISGLPPFCGFVGECLIYIGAFRGLSAFPVAGALGALALIVVLALVGGLAAASFVKMVGIIFLGESRSEASDHAHDPAIFGKAALTLGAALCLFFGLGAVVSVPLIGHVALPLAAIDTIPYAAQLLPIALLWVGGTLGLFVAVLAGLRHWLLRGREVTQSGTWGCGYSLPTARMQYTSASFAEPALAPFGMLFSKMRRAALPTSPFPAEAHLEERLDDRARSALGRGVDAFLKSLHALDFLQRGHVQLYLGYVLITLIALLTWLSFTGGTP